MAPNIYAYRARYLLSQYEPDDDDSNESKDPGDHEDDEKKYPKPTLPVCIIGAGMAGLYTAMIFDSLEIDYQIVDADTRDRIGGRLFTHKFSDVPYDYFEVGAMRFPDVPFMKRVFDLARNRNLPVKLIPYIMDMPPESRHTFLCYNGHSKRNDASSLTGDPFEVSSYVQELRTPEDAERKVSEVLRPFRDPFRPQADGKAPNIADAMKKLFEKAAGYSMRTYMSKVHKMKNSEISWCETLDKSTGWYDRALAETVIEGLAFDWPTAPLTDPDPSKSAPEPLRSGPDLRWYCFDGGSSTLPQAMFNSLSKYGKLLTKCQNPVTGISQDTENNCMRVSIYGRISDERYSAIISTVPLPRLGLLDLTGINIGSNYGQRSAIRELQYTPAIKIGIKFTTPWWETEIEPPIHGGQSHTDLPLRTIVYPSYPPGVTGDKMSKVLIASYCWTQDAQRTGALMNADGTMKRELIGLVFCDLAAVHKVEVEFIQARYVDHFAWDWLNNSLTMGGFALFGPGSYEEGGLYSQIIRPAAGGKLFLAGEATSSCHGWVAGALDSAWCAVDQYLALNRSKALRRKFWDKWGPTEFWDEISDDELVRLNQEYLDRHTYNGYT